MAERETIEHDRVFETTTMPLTIFLKIVFKKSPYLVMSFGLIFLVIAVTWLKLIWEKEERLGIRR